jgi:hypothetical protein
LCILLTFTKREEREREKDKEDGRKGRRDRERKEKRKTNSRKYLRLRKIQPRCLIRNINDNIYINSILCIISYK